MKFKGAVLALSPLVCLGCSHVRVTTSAKVDVVGRTVELGGSGGEFLGVSSDPDKGPAYQVTVHAHGEKYAHSLCHESDAFEVKRGFISIDVKAPITLLDSVTVDGMNEDGLSVSAHTLRQAIYQDEATAGSVQLQANGTLCFLSLVPWALSQFRLVEDLTARLRNTSVVANTIQPLPPGDRLHWAVEDASGNRAVIEYLDGKLHVHENSVGVMTNDPDYTWHLRNLNNYATIKGTDHDASGIQVQTAEVGAVPSVVGHGFNLWGMPGDISPPSRFVRLFYLRSLAVQNRGAPSTLTEGVKMIMGFLREVWITKGTAALSKGDGPGQFEFTQLSLVKVPQKRLFHFRSYDNTQWKVVNLTNVNFDKHSSMPLDDGSDGILDVTSKLLPSNSAGSTIFT